MTGPNGDGDDRTLYVHPETLARLFTQERVLVREVDRQAVHTFTDSDPLYPGRTIGQSTRVTPNSVHARRWRASDQTYIFEYIGDV